MFRRNTVLYICTCSQKASASDFCWYAKYTYLYLMSHCLLQLLHPPAILQCWSSAHWPVHAVWHINPHPSQLIIGTMAWMVPASLYSHWVPVRACPWGFDCCSLELWTGIVCIAGCRA